MSTVAVSTVLDREQLILTHLPQVRLLAVRQHRRCPPEVLLEDLVSAATVGLIQAVDVYDPGRKLKLKTLAEHRIRGAMLDYLRSLDPLPRSVRQFQRRREEAVTRLQQRSGHVQLESEIAAELKLSLSRYRLLDHAALSIVLSLENMTWNDHVRSAQAIESVIEETDLVRRLNSAIRNLPEPERTVIVSFQQGLTLREIAFQLGKHDSRASQIKANGIALLRKSLRMTTPVQVRTRSGR
jgi:RNA polymerase sigma factor for flagellar operon FliA